MIKNIWSKIEDKLYHTKILDKYILKQVIELFLMGVFVFTTIIFASDTFITLIKQIAKFGIPFKIAFIMILLNIPSVIVMTIPMGVLLSTVMTLNGLSLSSEITVMRACGISLNRIAKPIFGFAIIMALSSFVINETIVPAMTRQSTTLAMWSLKQKHIPNGKENFVFKETTDEGMLKRLFYVGLCEKNSLYNVTFIDLSKKGTIQVLQAKEGKTSPKGWSLKKCAAYTIGNQEHVLNTSLSDTLDVEFGLDFSKQENKDFAKQKNFTQLLKYLSTNDISPEDRQHYTIELFDKIALPITTIVFVLLGVPLAITPPRVKYNRGFLFSILIIFIYYVMRALSISFGGAGQLTPFLAAWLPNIVLTLWGSILYYKKVYTIS
jgi:lipopolysaccharide export system permease protein